MNAGSNKKKMAVDSDLNACTNDQRDFVYRKWFLLCQKEVKDRMWDKGDGEREGEKCLNKLLSITLYEHDF